MFVMRHKNTDPTLSATIFERMLFSVADLPGPGRCVASHRGRAVRVSETERQLASVERVP